MTMTRPTKSYNEVKLILGNAIIAFEKLISYIRLNYEMDEFWIEGKPSYKHFNNLFIKKSGKALLSLHLRNGFFYVNITFGSKEREKFEQQRTRFNEITCKIYDDATILHDGKWLGFKIQEDLLVNDITNLLQLKRKPNRKILIKDIDKCKYLDIGMLSDDILKQIT